MIADRKVELDMSENQETNPLWAPQGSVRATIALLVVIAFVAGAIPIEIATLVLGFYFGARTAAS